MEIISTVLRVSSSRSSTQLHPLPPDEGAWKGGATEEGQSHNGMPLDLNVQTPLLRFSFSQSSTERNSSILKFLDLIYRSERWFAAFSFCAIFIDFIVFACCLALKPAAGLSCFLSISITFVSTILFAFFNSMNHFAASFPAMHGRAADLSVQLRN